MVNLWATGLVMVKLKVRGWGMGWVKVRARGLVWVQALGRDLIEKLPFRQRTDMMPVRDNLVVQPSSSSSSGQLKVHVLDMAFLQSDLNRSMLAHGQKTQC